MEKSISEKINKSLSPEVLILENESRMHSGPRTESHFKLYVVSNKFEGMTRVERQRLVNDVLAENFKQGLHALTMKLQTQGEHKEKGLGGFVSPLCSSKKQLFHPKPGELSVPRKNLVLNFIEA